VEVTFVDLQSNKGSGERGNESSCSTRRGQFLGQLSDYELLMKDMSITMQKTYSAVNY